MEGDLILDYHIKNQIAMLSEDKIIALYCIVDDMLKEICHYEDAKIKVSDSEVITTAFVSVLYFGGHLDNARNFMKLKGYVPRMLGKSRFSRRLHRLSDFLLAMFYDMGKRLKDLAGAATYRLDSFRFRYVITFAFSAAGCCKVNFSAENMSPCEGISTACGYRF